MEYKGYMGIKPSQDTRDKWLLTRKLSHHEFKTIGSFIFPGFWTIEKYKTDRFFFRLAIFFEIIFLFSIFFLLGGVDILISVLAFSAVVVDLFGAFLHYKNGDNICRTQLKLNIENYLKGIKLSDNDKVKRKEFEFHLEKNNLTRKIGVLLILLSVLVKIVSSVVVFELPGLIFAAIVIYSFVAYIHINHSGYWFAGWNYRTAMKKQLLIELSSQDDLKNKCSEDDFVLTEVENIDSSIILKPIRHIIFRDSDIFDSLVFNEDQNKWYYRKWKHHFWDDNDVMNFINSRSKDNSVLSDSAKAFIACDIYMRNNLVNRNE